MDSLRGLAVLLVVLHHAVGVPRVLDVGGGLPLPGWDGFVAFFSSFRMPMLLVMSGMLLAGSVRKPLLAFASGKIRKVLWPYVVWVLLTLTALGGLSTVTEPLTWLTGPYHLWFLAVLLFCYPAGWCSRWIPAWVIAVGMVALLVVADPSSNWIRRVLFFGAIFMAGAALRRHLPSLLAMPGWLAGLLGAVGLGIACSHSFGWGLAQVDHRRVWTLVLPWWGALAAIWLWSRLPRLPWLEWVGQKSIVLYCVHFPVQGLSALALRDLAMSAPVLFVLVQVAVGIGVPMLVLWGYRHTKFLFELPALPRVERRSLEQSAAS